MKAYHVTFEKYKDSIIKEGLRVSKGGLDGPGVYAWLGPIEKAIKSADISLSDNHYNFSNEEFDKFLKTLCVFEIEYNELTPISIAWDDYIMFKNAISPEKLRYMGCFYDLTEKIYMGQ